MSSVSSPFVSALDLTTAIVHAPAHLSKLGPKSGPSFERRSGKAHSFALGHHPRDAPLVTRHGLCWITAWIRRCQRMAFKFAPMPMTETAQIEIKGNDARGLLFGVGYLLRHLEMTTGSCARCPQP